MANEQESVSPATAGGAPAPDLVALCAAALPALDAARKVFEAAAAPLPPFKRRPVLGEPTVNMTGDEDGRTWPEGVGWALSWGCQLSFGRDEKTNVPYVQVSLSDEDRRRGITQRSATRAQVAEFARMLAEQFGEPSTVVPDPCDAEIERLRGLVWQVTAERDRMVVELEQVVTVAGGDVDFIAEERGKAKSAVVWALGQLEQQRDEANTQRDSVKAANEYMRDAFREIGELVGTPQASPETVRSAMEKYLFELDQRRGERDEAREEWKRADAEVTRLVDAARANEQREFEAYAELLNPIREVFRKSPVGASCYRELRDYIDRLIGNANRLREQVANQRTEFERANADTVKAIKDRDAAEAERDRLRADLARERAVYADSPDDRLYHAADNTWWRRADDGRLVRAESPARADVDRLRTALSSAEADRDIAQANERDLRRRLKRIAQETSFESALPDTDGEVPF